MFGKVPTKRAVDAANRILQVEPEFYACTGRHTGIVHAHSELWCGFNLKIRLATTGVTLGADGETTDESPRPFRAGETVQIKGRGNHDTMHITFTPAGVDRLIVVTYDLSEGPVKPRVFLIRANILVSFARQFAKRHRKPTHPVRELDDGRIRVEWWSLFDGGQGNVKGSWDTWEARAERARRVLAKTHVWANGKFVTCGDRYAVA